jgi:hemin uptake protein HemP
MQDQDRVPPATDSRVAGDGGGELPRVDSRSLLGANREVVIAHDGVDYRLRLTASGKLILTK